MSEFRFRGFTRPTYTMVPDQIFDELLPHLREAELKALLYIIRRTFGFKKESDAISFSQFLNGITTKEGRVLDKGCGLSNRTSLSKALQSLEAKRIIETLKRRDEQGDKETTVYRLCFVDNEVVREVYYPSTVRVPPVVREPYLQETVLQETVLQETDNSKFEGSPHSESISHSLNNELSQNISRLMTDFSKQVLHDSEHTKANVTQAHNIWHQSGLSQEEFLEALYAVKRIVLEWSGNIHKLADGQSGLKNRAPYFFQVLRNLVLLEEG